MITVFMFPRNGGAEMVLGRAEWPETGELIVATVSGIVPYGAYVKLDEYDDKEGLIHISELSSRWVKNIRDHVREGQKTVLQVLRVDPEKGHVDLSLRRVGDRERREKLLQWKQAKRGELILERAAEEMGVSHEDAYKEVGSAIEAQYGSIYAGLEEAVERGEKTLVKVGVPSGWATLLTEIAKAKIRVRRVGVKGVLELTSPGPDGVEVLRGAFKKAMSVRKPGGTHIKIYVLGAPRYRIEVSSRGYKTAEEVLDNATKAAIEVVEAAGGEGKFLREH